MASRAAITITNNLGSLGEPPSTDLTLSPVASSSAPKGAYLTSGQIDQAPANVPNQTQPTRSNGGIYASTVQPPDIRGIVNYTLPDEESQLVIFISLNRSVLLIVTKSMQPDPGLVETADSTGQARVTGSFPHDGKIYNFVVSIYLTALPSLRLRLKTSGSQISVQTSISDDGKTFQIDIDAVNTEKR